MPDPDWSDEKKALADLIDSWWEDSPDRTLVYDGVELIASGSLADVLLRHGWSYDWLDDDSLSSEERMARFNALRPAKTRGPSGSEHPPRWD